MKRNVLAALAVTAIATGVAANESIEDVVVFDHNKTVYQSVPVTSKQCYNVDVPLYETVTKQGNGGDALVGGLIGGAIGNQMGNGNGKDVMTALGAIFGATQATKPRTEQRIVGYRTERQCDDVMTYQDIAKEVYSHSTIRFYVDGKRYVLDFVK